MQYFHFPFTLSTYKYLPILMERQNHYVQSQLISKLPNDLIISVFFLRNTIYLLTQTQCLLLENVKVTSKQRYPTRTNQEKMNRFKLCIFLLMIMLNLLKTLRERVNPGLRTSSITRQNGRRQQNNETTNRKTCQLIPKAKRGA